MTLTLDDISQRLEDVVLKPFGIMEWQITADIGETGDLQITVTNNFANDSTIFNFFDGEGFRHDVTEMHSQEFDSYYNWPETVEQLDKQIARAVAWAAAHEFLEWLVADDGNLGKRLYDPHANSVDVMLGA